MTWIRGPFQRLTGLVITPGEVRSRQTPAPFLRAINVTGDRDGKMDASADDSHYLPLHQASLSGIDVWPDQGSGLPPLDPEHNALALAVAKVLLCGPFEQTAMHALEIIGKNFDADRAWTVSYNANLASFRDTNEWCWGGVATHNIDNLDIPSTALGAMHGLMRGGHPVVVFDVAAMPKSMRALQTKIQLQDTVSTVGIPIRFDSELRGIMGLDMIREQRRWAAADVAALCHLADLMAHAWFGGESTAATSTRPSQDEFFYFQGLRGIVGANLNDIAACNAERDSTRIYLANGDDVLDNRNLSWWETVLPESHFMRVHRSSILQLRMVQRLQRRGTGQWLAYIEGMEQTFSVSRARVVVLRNRLGC